MTRWFVSDHHLDHHNILEYAQRPFKDVDEMDQELLSRHNDVVKPEDHVSFLGDLTMRRGSRLHQDWLVEAIQRFNGHKRLYLGNHDHFDVEVYLRAGFEKVYATWRDETGIIYSHIPLHPSSIRGEKVRANVHGHIHQRQSPDPLVFEGRVTPYINVSVEAIGYRPISHEELMARIASLQP